MSKEWLKTTTSGNMKRKSDGNQKHLGEESTAIITKIIDNGTDRRA